MPFKNLRAVLSFSAKITWQFFTAAITYNGIVSTEFSDKNEGTR
jgi:hypothetical protein